MAPSDEIGDEKSRAPINHSPAIPETVSTGIPVGDADIAIAIVGERRQDVDPAVEARVVRKIDLFLVPAMFVGYGLVYYDKVNANLR